MLLIIQWTLTGIVKLIFAEYVNGGEMFTHLNQRERFTEDEARLYIAEVTLALEHLHNVSTE